MTRRAAGDHPIARWFGTALLLCACASAPGPAHAAEGQLPPASVEPKPAAPSSESSGSLCRSDNDCWSWQECDDRKCVPRTENRSSAMVAGGAVAMSVGIAGTIAMFYLIITGISPGGGEGDPLKRIGSAAVGGPSIGLILTGAVLVMVGGEDLPVAAPRSGHGAGAHTTQCQLTPLLGPGFAGVRGTF